MDESCGTNPVKLGNKGTLGAASQPLLIQCPWVRHFSTPIQSSGSLGVACFQFNVLGPTFFHCNKVPQGAWESATSDSIPWVQEFSIAMNPSISIDPCSFPFFTSEWLTFTKRCDIIMFLYFFYASNETETKQIGQVLMEIYT